MDFYQAQNKYRQKQFRFILNSLLKLFIIVIAVLVGWRFGNSDKTILIQENEKTINKFDAKKRFLERQLADTRLKLKEANLALDIQNIKGKQSSFGRVSKNILALNLAKGVPENIIIDNLRLLSAKKTCDSFNSKELSVITESFIPPQNRLILLSGGLKIKAEGNIIDKTKNHPYFDQLKPLRITLKYLGNNEIIEGILPIKKTISAGKFLVLIEVINSKVRGAVLVRYKTCKI
ncbi:hypothetical protein OAT42_00740 [Alphaproteobacteria bacterium]|nr:hypothetical protein [Alphaproteobacteria bacterium]